MSGLRDLDAGLVAKLSAQTKEPGYLVEMELPGQTVRLSSRGAISALGQSWQAFNVEVRNLDSGGESGGSLRLGNADNMMSALVLGADGVAGYPVRVYAFYSDAPADTDIEQVFDGMADEAGLNTDVVETKLKGDPLFAITLPAGRISPAWGFNHLTPPGTVLVWGNERIVLGVENG